MLKSLSLIFLLLLTASAQVISYPTVPPGLPAQVLIDSLGQQYGGHSFKLDVYGGAFTFHTKAQGDFTGVATVVWFGQSDKYNTQSVVLGAKSVITFSYATAKIQKFGPADFVVQGWLDVCTQTGSVTLGRLSGSYNISNQVIHTQCSGGPAPVAHQRCITDGSSSLKFNTNSGAFTLIIGGQFRTAGSLLTVANVGDLTVLRSPGDDTDVTVLLIGDVAQVTVLSHKSLLVTFSGQAAECQ